MCRQWAHGQFPICRPSRKNAPKMSPRCSPSVARMLPTCRHNAPLPSPHTHATHWPPTSFIALTNLFLLIKPIDIKAFDKFLLLSKREKVFYFLPSPSQSSYFIPLTFYLQENLPIRRQSAKTPACRMFPKCRHNGATRSRSTICRGAKKLPLPHPIPSNAPSSPPFTSCLFLFTYPKTLPICRRTRQDAPNVSPPPGHGFPICRRSPSRRSQSVGAMFPKCRTDVPHLSAQCSQSVGKKPCNQLDTKPLPRPN